MPNPLESDPVPPLQRRIPRSKHHKAPYQISTFDRDLNSQILLGRKRLLALLGE